MKIETHFFRSGSSTPTEQLLEMTKEYYFQQDVSWEHTEEMDLHGDNWQCNIDYATIFQNQ